ncbi:MAG: methionine--tRNA ligase, partial [Chloroflexota bacterium]
MTDQRSVYYITTSIPYVNARPHVGHALEFVQTDAYARFHRQKGEDVFFLSGSDENSLTNVLAAEAEGISTRELVDRNVAFFEEALRKLDCSNDDFIRTSSEQRHFDGAEKLWKAMDVAGDVYSQQYTGLYCVRCEQFYTEEELVDGKCPDHRIPPVVVEEENYFFRLSKYADELHRLISTDEMKIVPESRKNEVLRFIERGLEDFSISRSQERARGWGVPVPGDESQVMYVWVDALSNYITALDYANEGDLYQRYWVNADHRVHEIGKNIIRFHAIYWPAMLLSAGVKLPTEIVVHGFLTIDGEKMSKTLGNVIDPIEVVDQYGADAVRYYLLREVSPGGDGDFSIGRLIQRYNNDLANDLGNLVNRTVSMINRYRDGVIPESGERTELEDNLIATLERGEKRYAELFAEYEPQQALNAAWESVTATNTYVEQAAPWVVARQIRDGDESANARLDTILATLAEAVSRIGWTLQPVLPTSVQEIARQLGSESLDTVPSPGQLVAKPQPIFPR